MRRRDDCDRRHFAPAFPAFATASRSAGARQGRRVRRHLAFAPGIVLHKISAATLTRQAPVWQSWPVQRLDKGCAPFETVASLPPQDEAFSLCHPQTALILRSARRARLEGPPVDIGVARP